MPSALCAPEVRQVPPSAPRVRGAKIAPGVPDVPGAPGPPGGPARQAREERQLCQVRESFFVHAPV